MLGDDTVTKLGSSHFTDITCPWGRRGQNIGLGYFCHIPTLLPPGHPCFTNTCLLFTCYLPIQPRHVSALKHKTSIRIVIFLFVCSFLVLILFVIFALFNLLYILFIYFIYLFIFLASQFSRNARPFPFITTDKNLRSTPVLYATILVHLRQRHKCTIVITHCPSSVRRRELFTLSTSPLNH